MLYDFYNWYQIDDSAIWCWKIIAVDCNNLHYYVNPCDLIEDCLLQIPQQLTKQCIVDFFNTTIDTIPAGYVLRVDWSHCVEAVPLSFSDTDELVAVSATDTPGYLWAKLVGCTLWGWRWITVTPIGPMGNEQLQICMSYDPHVVIVPTIPGCDGAYLRGNMDWTTYRDCGSGWNDSLRATLYTSNNIAITPPTNKYKAYFFANNVVRPGLWTIAGAGPMNIYRGNPSMKWTWLNSSKILITKSGMYDIRMKWEAIINRWVARVRLFVAWTVSENIFLDSKFWPETERTGTPSQCMPYQYLDWATPRWIDDVTYTFNWHNMVYLTQGEILAMWCKIDSRYCNGVSPSVNRQDSVYDLGEVNPGWSTSEISKIGSWLTFWVRYSSPNNRGFSY